MKLTPTPRPLSYACIEYVWAGLLGLFALGSAALLATGAVDALIGLAHVFGWWAAAAPALAVALVWACVALGVYLDNKL